MSTVPEGHSPACMLIACSYADIMRLGGVSLSTLRRLFQDQEPSFSIATDEFVVEGNEVRYKATGTMPTDEWEAFLRTVKPPATA